MASNMPVVKDEGGIGDITQLLALLGPLLGSGTTKTGSASTTSGDPSSNAQADELLKQLLESVSSGNLDLLESGVLDRANEKLAPQRIGPNAAGVRAYSDSTLRAAEQDAARKAAAEAMAVRLQATAQAHKTASGLVETKMQVNKTVAQQQQQKTGPNTAGKLLSVGLPAAMIYSKLRGPRRAGIPQNQQDDPSHVVSSAYGENELGSTDVVPETQFPVQEFQETGLTIDPSESTIPAPFAFGDEGAFVGDMTIDNAGFGDSLAAADAENLSALEAGDNLSILEGVSQFEEVDEFASIFENFDTFGFADGGIVTPGKRPSPTAAYTSTAMQARTSVPIQRQSLAKGTSPISSTSVPTTKKKSLTKSDVSSSNEEDSEGSDPNPAEPTADVPAGVQASMSSLGLGPVSLGLAIMKGAIGVPPVEIGFQLAKVAAINKAIDLIRSLGFEVPGVMPEAIIDQEAIGLMQGMPPAVIDPTAFATPPELNPAGSPTPEGMPAATVDVDSIASMDDDDPSSPSPDSDPTSDSDTTSDSNSSSDSDSGGDGFTKGGEIQGNRRESRGIDKKVIKVTPGEFIIPKDTVAILGEDFFEDLIAMTHTPIRGRA